MGMVCRLKTKKVEWFGTEHGTGQKNKTTFGSKQQSSRVSYPSSLLGWHLLHSKDFVGTITLLNWRAINPKGHGHVQRSSQRSENDSNTNYHGVELGSGGK